MKIEIQGTIPGKKNNKLLVKRGNRTIPITKPEIQARLNEIKGQMAGNKYSGVYPVTVEIMFWLVDNRRRDLDNMASSVLDCLVESGVIVDDSTKCVCDLILVARHGESSRICIEISEA